MEGYGLYYGLKANAEGADERDEARVHLAPASTRLYGYTHDIDSSDIIQILTAMEGVNMGPSLTMLRPEALSQRVIAWFEIIAF